ncbi:hypothetical protein F5883DRAFT_613987 [Diaporthe sp. PMI_573]|nr:hypothetical protein F5883DRAFT_613987 [Diaporthaceae sp. PMI_573]
MDRRHGPPARFGSHSRYSLPHSSPEYMAQSWGAGNSYLESLPDELLTAIFDKLLDDDERSEHDIHKDLVSLCRVSKRIDPVARPLLFEKVTILRPHTLILIYRTLLGTGCLAEQIKEIYFDDDFRDGLRCLSDPERRELFYCISQYSPGTFHDVDNDSDILGVMLYKIPKSAVNLRLLQICIQDTPNPYIRFDLESFEEMRMHRPGYSAFFKRVGYTTRPGVEGLAPAFLPRLETLALREYCQSGLGFEVFGPFLDIPSLRTVEGSCDDGNWCHLAPLAELYKTLPRLKGDRLPRHNITKLALTDSSACLYDFEDIAQLFPRLEVLSVMVRSSQPGRLEHYIARGSRRDLSTTLGKMTALRILETDMYPNPDITSRLYGDITASLGPGNVLSLARLPNLEQIQIPLYMFAHVGPPPFGAVAAIPREVLPRSLKSMTLLAHCKCGLTYERQPCWDSTTSLLEFLESLRDDLVWFPELETVTYCFGSRSCGHPYWRSLTYSPGEDEDEDFIHSRLQAIQDAFWKHKVQFRLQKLGHEGTQIIDL